MELLKYSKVPIIRPPMVLVENGLNSDQVSLMRPICIFSLKAAFRYLNKWF